MSTIVLNDKSLTASMNITYEYLENVIKHPLKYKADVKQAKILKSVMDMFFCNRKDFSGLRINGQDKTIYRLFHKTESVCYEHILYPNCSCVTTVKNGDKKVKCEIHFDLYGKVQSCKFFDKNIKI